MTGIEKVTSQLQPPPALLADTLIQQYDAAKREPRTYPEPQPRQFVVDSGDDWPYLAAECLYCGSRFSASESEEEVAKPGQSWGQCYYTAKQLTELALWANTHTCTQGGAA